MLKTNSHSMLSLKFTLASLGAFMLPGAALADVPTQFEDGQVIYAEEVNENFSSLDDRLNQVDLTLPPAGGALSLNRESDTDCGAFVSLKTNNDDANGWIMKNSSAGCDVPDEFGDLQWQAMSDQDSPKMRLKQNGVLEVRSLSVNRLTDEGNMCGSVFSIGTNDNLEEMWGFKTSNAACDAGTKGEMHLYTVDDGISRLSINRTGDVVISGSLQQLSDARLKTGITQLEGSLADILSLEGVSYFWIDSNSSQERQIGVIAQDVEAVFPELVRTDSSGTKSVNYAGLVAPMIEAVREQQTTIEAQQARIETLEKNQALTLELMERLDALERLASKTNSSR